MSEGLASRQQGIAALRDAILRDARETARREIQRARADVAREREEAAHGAGEERESILREAARRAGAVERRILSLADLESKRRMLEVRERLIQDVVKQVLEALRSIADPESRRDILLQLLLEAAREAGGGSLEARASAQDQGLLTAGLLAEAREILAREGIEADLRPAGLPVEILGGAIVSRDEGRIVVDNSIDARLRRSEPQLRAAIWRILSGSERPSRAP